MAGYISEFSPYGDTSQEFIEIALPVGTDPSGYVVQIYGNNGELIYSIPIGSPTGTMSGHDVYVIDAATTPGYDDGGNDPTGRMYPDDALALVDGDGNVLQFTSYFGNTVTATNGPASGMTSTDAGNAQFGESLQSDDGGSTYYAQSAPNSGTIPACYAPGSLIATPCGLVRVEDLRPDDTVLGVNGRAHKLCWVWSGRQPLDALAPHQKPVLIRAGAFGAGLPSQDLIVSGQHRIVVGAFGQLEDVFDEPHMVPAKALTALPGIRHVQGKRSILWHHILCDAHQIVFASGLASETLLLGAGILRPMSRLQLADLSRAVGRTITRSTQDRTVLPCLSVGVTRRAVAGRAKNQRGLIQWPDPVLTPTHGCLRHPA